MWFRLVTVVFRYFLYLMVALTLCVSSMGDYRPSYVDRVVAPLKYSFIEWELGHLSDKWIYRLKNSVFKNHTKDRESALLEVREHFRLAEALKERTKLIADNHTETSRLSGYERKCYLMCGCYKTEAEFLWAACQAPLLPSHLRY